MPIVEPSGAPGGGSQPGTAIVRGPFPIAYSAAGLAASGVAFYTPTVNDIWLDAWVEFDTNWDGTTPTLDIGTFVGVSFGIFSAVFGGVDASAATDGESAGAGVLQAHGLSSDLRTALNAIASAPYWSVTPPPEINTGGRWLPAKFTAANPLKVVVSRDGTKGGADPGSTQGAATIYIVTATPTAA